MKILRDSKLEEINFKLNTVLNNIDVLQFQIDPNTKKFLTPQEVSQIVKNSKTYLTHVKEILK